MNDDDLLTLSEISLRSIVFHFLKKYPFQCKKLFLLNFYISFTGFTHQMSDIHLHIYLIRPSIHMFTFQNGIYICEEIENKNTRKDRQIMMGL